MFCWSFNFQSLIHFCRPQLYDVLGTAQTITAHEAAMKLLNLNSEADVDKAERYFWALALGSQPLQAVIQGDYFFLSLVVISF